MTSAKSFLAAGVISFCASAALAGPPASIPSSDPAMARAEASFQEFAQGWMKKMEAAEANNRAHANGGAFRGYDEDFKIELKPTGSASAPYVGLLRYEEQQCAAGSGGACSVASTTLVTEIFRFQGGRWVY
jgi:hypothetical protein